MKRITIEVSDQDKEQLEELVKLCNRIDGIREGATTHGPLTVPRLLAMLAEDAALVLRRPGSWEGATMHQLLTSHGYEV